MAGVQSASPSSPLGTSGPMVRMRHVFYCVWFGAVLVNVVYCRAPVLQPTWEECPYVDHLQVEEWVCPCFM